MMAWSIKDDEHVLEVIEDDELWECLGEAIPTGWAFAWPDQATAGVTDLGGWREEAGEIEAARLIIREQDLTVLSADRGTLDEIAFLLEANLGELIVPRRESLAA
jgi:hypothetical protein